MLLLARPTRYTHATHRRMCHAIINRSIDPIECECVLIINATYLMQRVADIAPHKERIDVDRCRSSILEIRAIPEALEPAGGRLGRLTLELLVQTLAGARLQELPASQPSDHQRSATSQRPIQPSTSSLIRWASAYWTCFLVAWNSSGVKSGCTCARYRASVSCSGGIGSRGSVATSNAGNGLRFAMCRYGWSGGCEQVGVVRQ